MRLCAILMLGLSFCATGLVADDSYMQQIIEWHAQREENLRKPDGWLSLAGLFWLKEGENSFGADAANDICFPAGKAEDFIGTLLRSGGKVVLRVNDNVHVTSNGESVSTITMQPDTAAKPTIVQHRSLLWYVIVRGERIGIRLKDTESEAIKNFTGLPMFPITVAWRIKARVELYDPPKILHIPDVLGDISAERCPAALVFEYAGRECRLEPTDQPGDKEWFLIFADASNGDETYGGGRFLYVDAPDQNGETWLDFNKAYNPPCVFTPYATCPLPPPGNRLPFKVTAGEKNYGAGHH